MGATCRFSMPFQHAASSPSLDLKLFLQVNFLACLHVYALIPNAGQPFRWVRTLKEEPVAGRVSALMPRINVIPQRPSGTDSSRHVLCGNGNHRYPRQVVFIDDALCDIEQADIGHHARLQRLMLSSCSSMSTRCSSVRLRCRRTAEPVKAQSR